MDENHSIIGKISDSLGSKGAIILVLLSFTVLLSSRGLPSRLDDNFGAVGFLLWLKESSIALDDGWSAYREFSDNVPLKFLTSCDSVQESAEHWLRIHTWNMLRVADPQTILTKFGEAYCLHGEIFGVHYLRLLEANGRMLLEQGIYPEAVERMRIAQASLWPIRREHRSLIPPYCIEAFQSGRFAEAELFCQINDEAGQGVASAVMLGRVFLAQDRLEDARFNFHNAIERDASHYEGYFWLGQVEWALDNHEEAIGLFEQSLVLEPNNGEAWLLLIEVNLDNNKPESAHLVFQEARSFLSTVDLERALKLLE